MPSDDPVKFLIVDDLEENLLALAALLRQDGLVIMKARSGMEALELLLQHDFALALLDVQMPGMDGFELAELMRGTERTRHVPIIFITAAATDEGRRFRGYEAGAVDYVFKPVDPLVIRSKARIFFEMDRHRQEIARQRNELEATAHRLSDALHRLQAHSDNSPLAIIEIDQERRVVAWSNGAERMFGWGARELIGRRLDELRWIEEQSMDWLQPLLAAGQGSNQPQRHGPHRLRATHRDGSTVETEWYSSVLRSPDGKTVSVSAQVLDVTERRRAEETQRLLIGELNHRVKNTLASVQAIATQTLRHTRNPEEFSATFSGRIQSLARAHAMLSQTTWKDAPLAELIRDQLRLGTIDEGRITISGPEVQLAPQEALRLAMIFHELSTNANKYGAFSNSSGRVALNWSVEGGQLRLGWKESGGPAVKAPTRRGFGTRLIEQSLDAEGGHAKASYSSEGISWDIAMPLQSPAPSSLELRLNLPVVAPVAHPVPQVVRPDLAGTTILVIEDETLVAIELASVLEDAGIHIIGPATTVEDAMRLVEDERYDAAFLDGNLRGKPVEEIAAALTRRNAPFAFVSGYGQESLPSGFAGAPVISKPFSPGQLLQAAEELTRPKADVIRLRS